MASDPKSLQDAILYFADFQNCQNFMIELRWAGGKVVCPYCGSEKVTYLRTARVWKCYGRHEKAKFSLKVGTIFEDSAVSLDKWFVALWLLVNCRNAISSYEVAKDIGISQKSAWHLVHRLRFALHSGSSEKMLSGHIKAGESFIGGRVRNVRVSKRALENFWSLPKRSISGRLRQRGGISPVPPSG